MAGRLKHMERSRRSHRVDTSVFTAFNRNAYVTASRKEAVEANQHSGFYNFFKRMMPSKEA